MQTDNVARSTDTALHTTWHALRCGPLDMHFDPTLAALRTIRLGDREVVRAVYVAVRDRNWETVVPQIPEFNLTAANGGFRIAFVAECREQGIDFRWQGHIVGEPTGSLRFEMDGEAHSAFLRNRIGFCILHPIRECAGQPCRVTTADGTTVEGVFPGLIAPHQPFCNMRAIRYEALPGLWAELTFAGDIFEMEDQRNWTDASYKTYCTPLALPYPVEVPQGTRIRQSVSLTLHGALPVAVAIPGDRNEPVTLRLPDAPPMPMPKIGLGMASHSEPLTEREIERLALLGLSHLRLDLNLAKPDWEPHLRRATREADAVGAQLEIALFLTDDGLDARLAALEAAIERLRPQVARWLVFHTQEKTTPEPLLLAARAALAPLTPNAPFGGGTNAYFAELNRSRPSSDRFDFVCWSINPQVHAADTASLMENLEAQAETVRTARAFCGERPLVISPVTLKPRFNPNATGPEPAPLPGELPAQVDARQATLLGAAWTLGSLKALCESGVHSITYYETTGWRGVMNAEAGSPFPEAFSSAPIETFPLYEVFSTLREGEQLLPLESSAPGKVDGIAFEAPGAQRRAVLCANLTAHTQTVRLLLPPHIMRVRIRQMDANKARMNYLPPDYAAYDPGEFIEVQDGIVERELTSYALALLEWEALYGQDEHGTDEHGTDEHGTDEHGTDEHGTDEHGTDEHGTDEHGTDEKEDNG